ncbi:MAG: hypothetical protein Q9220_004457 [cf. Caloplaca sp. 1 TL-2023]
MNGQPPNGGVPPGVLFFGMPQPASVPPAPAPPPPPPPPPPPYTLSQYPTQPDPRLWNPPLYAAPPSLPPPPPPPPPPAPASAPGYWSPPGATLLGEPAPVISGVQYLSPPDHVVLHVNFDINMRFDTATPPFNFKAFVFAQGLTVEAMIRQLGAPQGADSKFGITQVHPLGEGRWAVGQTILLDSPYAKKTLREIGWHEVRGFEFPPVWLKIATV